VATPAELIEQGKWTFDYFEEYLPLISDKSKESPVYGLGVFTGVHSSLITAAVFANNGEMVKYENNKYSFGYNDQNALTAIDFAIKINAMKDCVSTVKSFGSELFSGGNSTLALTSSWRGTQTTEKWEIMNNLSDVSWYPFPYGPNAEYGKTSSYYLNGADLATTIVNNDKQQETGIVFDCLFSPLDEFGKDGIYGYFKNNLFFNVESYDVFTKELHNLRYDYYTQLSDEYENITNTLNNIVNKKISPQEGLLSMTEVINNKLNETLNS
jgi:hypothetical protein